jgi:hypothetical protein
VMAEAAPREAVENWGVGATAGVAGEAGIARPPGDVMAGVARCAGVATLTPLGIEAGAFTESGLTDGKGTGAPLGADGDAGTAGIAGPPCWGTAGVAGVTTGLAGGTTAGGVTVGGTPAGGITDGGAVTGGLSTGARPFSLPAYDSATIWNMMATMDVMMSNCFITESLSEVQLPVTHKT